jgi:hypothetical protein
MGRALPPVAASRRTGLPETIVPSCPCCGTGDLFLIAVTRGAGEVLRVGYCAGVYDRDRRRFLRRSCGYSGPESEISGPVRSDGSVRPPSGPRPPES